MKELRKVSDIWKTIDDKRILSKMNKQDWRRSFEGVKTAIESIGLIMITTKEEFDKLEIPISRDYWKRYNQRKIEVSRNSILSKACIDSILSGGNSLKSDEELKVVYKDRGVVKSLEQPKGIATNTNAESKTIDDLDILIGISDYAHRIHLYEFRLFDIVYCMNENDLDTDIFVADQIKTAKVCENGCLNFNEMYGNLTVKTMISILENGSLTCIGKTRDNKVDVVWFFYGNDVIKMLHKFNINQNFRPRLHLAKKKL